MTASIIALAVLGFSPANVDISVNVQNGDHLSGERSFKVTVASNAPVTQVEFYVGSELRENDTSTPYEFKLDTLTVPDGDLKVTFAAYTNDGQSAKKSLTLVVDNGIGKGADFHVKHGVDMLQLSKWDDAITSGRVALKADKNSNPARLVLARAYLGKGVLDKAQQFAEDAATADPKDLQALEILSAINLQVAFNTLNRGGDKQETKDAIKAAFKTAVESRRKSLDQQLDSMGTPTDANLLAYADMAIQAQRYSAAISVLQPAFIKDNRRNDVGNRLAFAQLRAGRLGDAVKTMADLKKYGTLDAYGQALQAVIYTEAGNDAASDDALKEGLLSDSDNLGVRTAQAYIALKRNKTNTLAKFSADLAREQGQRTEVNYFLSALTNRLSQFAESRRYFERAVLAEPTNYDMYIEQGNESINVALSRGLEKKDVDAQYDNARMMFETALLARPESYEALTGLAIVDMMQKKPAEAVKHAQAAVGAGKSYAGAYYALSAAYEEAKMADKTQATADYDSKAQKANETAGKLDRLNLEGRSVPNAIAAWKYFSTGGRSPVLAPPK